MHFSNADVRAIAPPCTALHPSEIDVMKRTIFVVTKVNLAEEKVANHSKYLKHNAYPIARIDLLFRFGELCLASYFS